ncbi:MAG: hypothetical protein VYA34_09665 [Myxococcota bacterium]|nr:hypothetical protein [Myxococcota bacterium]
MLRYCSSVNAGTFVIFCLILFFPGAVLAKAVEQLKIAPSFTLKLISPDSRSTLVSLEKDISLGTEPSLGYEGDTILILLGKMDVTWDREFAFWSALKRSFAGASIRIICVLLGPNPQGLRWLQQHRKTLEDYPLQLLYDRYGLVRSRYHLDGRNFALFIVNNARRILWSKFEFSDQTRMEFIEHLGYRLGRPIVGRTPAPLVAWFKNEMEDQGIKVLPSQ